MIGTENYFKEATDEKKKTAKPRVWAQIVGEFAHAVQAINNSVADPEPLCSG